MAADDGYTYVHGLVQDRNTLRAAAQIDTLNAMGAPNTSTIKWAMPSGDAAVFHLDRYVTRLCLHRRAGTLELLLVAPDGWVQRADSNGLVEGTVCPDAAGTAVHGVIRDVRAIGDDVYAVGMGRQVYRRGIDGVWVRFDAGVLQEATSMALAGFNAIHGRDAQDLYAAGVGGEIWRCHRGQWEQLESPTQTLLNAVHMLPDGRVLAAGNNGVLLCGSGTGTWKVVDAGITTQIWGIEHFNGCVYLATRDAVYRLDDALRAHAVDMGLGPGVTCGALHADDGVLLSTGPKSICWTTDGITWHALR